MHRNPAAFTAPDTRTCGGPATELLHHGTFTTQGRPEVFRTPGYPLLLLPGLGTGQLTAVTIAIQIALSLLTVAGVFALALAVTVTENARAAAAAAGVYAVEPLSVEYASLLLTETLFTALLVCAR